MKRAFAFLLLATTLRAAPPATPGPVLSPDNEGAWQSLFDSLAAPRAIESSFVEERWFGFRKTPVVLQGEMRLDPARGLSLQYLKPEERVVVIDPKGVLLRDRRGNTHALPADARATGIERALLPALRFDWPEIRNGFVVHAARDGSDWRLDLDPKNANLARTLGDLIIEGTDRQVTRIEFRRSATQRVVIRIVTTREGIKYSADELREFFR